MPTLLLDSGIIPYRPVSAAVEQFLRANALAIVNHPGSECGWEGARSGVKRISYPDLDLAAHIATADGAQQHYTRVLSAILDDIRTSLLAERIYGMSGWNSAFSQVRLVEKQVLNSLNLLLSIRPDGLLFQATPHHIRQWVLARTAECLGVPVYAFQTSPLPWRFRVIRGAAAQVPVDLAPAADLTCSQGELALLERYLERNSAGYADAIPSYERKRIESRGGKFWSWGKELRDVIQHPSLLRAVFPRWLLYKKYDSLTTPVPTGRTPYVVLFLHYQPEATSLPEGGMYAQQWLIVRALSLVLPKGHLLLVKEHPSTFMHTFRQPYRCPEFYDDMASLANVRLVSIAEDTFRLIDGADAVATITGTVGVQALIRGTPVLAFGPARYRGMDGVFEVRCLEDIVECYKELETVSRSAIRAATVQYLRGCLEHSVSGLGHQDGRVTQVETVDVHAPALRISGHCRLLEVFLRWFSELPQRHAS